MKKVLILLMTIGILASCNNNNKPKGGGLFGGLNNTNKNNDRNKDDYGNNNNGKNANKEDNERTTTGSWTKEDESTFLRGCNANINGGKAGEQVCSCILEKLENTYRSLDDADQTGGPEAGSRLQKQCMKELNINDGDNEVVNPREEEGTEGRWSEADVQQKISECAQVAIQGGNTRTAAQSYCSCMIEKLQRIYPSAREYDQNIAEDMQKPRFKQMIADCQP